MSGRTIISNAIGLKECAIVGMGIALLLHWLIEREIEAGKLIKILPNYEVTATVFDTSAWLVYPCCTYLPLRVKVFIDFFKQHFRLVK
ncbi:MAG TPA: LysR substrate-binding domain-containing protein [Coleofasciculaceae cyanobacterium]